MGRMLSALKQIEAKKRIVPRRVEPITPAPETAPVIAAPQEPAPRESIEQSPIENIPVEPAPQATPTVAYQSPMAEPEMPVTPSEPLPSVYEAASVQQVAVPTVELFGETAEQAIKTIPHEETPEDPPVTTWQEESPGVNRIPGFSSRLHPWSAPVTRDATEFERALAVDLNDPLERRQYRRLADEIQTLQRGSGSIALMFASPWTNWRNLETLARTATVLCDETADEVLVVDADSSKNSLTAQLEMQGEQGLSEVLQGDTPWRDAIRPTTIDRLRVLPIGRSEYSENNAGNLSLVELLDDLKRQFPIVLVASDSEGPLSIALGRGCEATYLLVHLGRTRSQCASEALERLQISGARVLGCVVTNAPQHSG